MGSLNPVAMQSAKYSAGANTIVWEIVSSKETLMAWLIDEQYNYTITNWNLIQPMAWAHSYSGQSMPMIGIKLIDMQNMYILHACTCVCVHVHNEGMRACMLC